MQRREHRSGAPTTAAPDTAAEELRIASTELGRITGAVDVEEVLDVSVLTDPFLLPRSLLLST